LRLLAGTLIWSTISLVFVSQHVPLWPMNPATQLQALPRIYTSTHISQLGWEIWMPCMALNNCQLSVVIYHYILYRRYRSQANHVISMLSPSDRVHSISSEGMNGGYVVYFVSIESL